MKNHCSSGPEYFGGKFAGQFVSLKKLIEDIYGYYGKLGKRPVFQLNENSLFIIISQAPGKKVHDTGIPWNDVSGRLLRNWLGVTDAQFYDKELFSIMPIDFCYPGKGAHGDLSPDPACARMWHPKILAQMKNKPLKLLIGSYAIKYYLKEKQEKTLPETIRNYEQYLPGFFPMVHPSPRNKNWLKKNAWFGSRNIPFIREFIQAKIKERIK